MSFSIKTLIVFDSNTLRSTDNSGGVVYNSFSLGGAYHSVERFIEENALTDNVKLAIPAFVIEELKRQKQRSYDDDIRDLKNIINRLSGLPHINLDDLKIPDAEFSCAEFIEGEARTYISNNEINLLDLNEEDAPSILKIMMDKVVNHKTPKRPFFVTGGGDRIKDAGFKDNIIWEVLMHFKGIADFDKVIFVSNDAGFNDCKPEFQAKWGKHFELATSFEAVKIALQLDYGNYIENRNAYEYANTDYFKDFLDDELRKVTFVDYEGESIKIENYKITNFCKNVEKVPDEEGDFSSVDIVSEIIVYTTFDGGKIEIPVYAKTNLSDLENKVIEEITFEPYIY